MLLCYKQDHPCSLRSDASKAFILSTFQRNPSFVQWRLSEIGLEDYSFVLLSRFANAIEDRGGFATLAEEAKKSKLRTLFYCKQKVVLHLPFWFLVAARLIHGRRRKSFCICCMAKLWILSTVDIQKWLAQSISPR